VTSEVTVNGLAVDLTPIEYRLITELVNHIGSPVSPADLLERVWGPDYQTENLVKWHMSGYARKLVTPIPRTS